MTCVFQNAGEESQDPLRIIKRLARFTYVTDRMRDDLARAAFPDDIVSAKKQGRRCFYMSSNGVPLTQSWVSVEEELRCIRVFFQLGVRMMHLIYNRRNMIGDGCAAAANAGLSDFGRAVIGEMNRTGVIPDLAHAGWQTSLDTAGTSQRPVVASHSSCHAIHPHIRGKPGDVIRAIADTGGYIGICCIPAFLGRSGDIQALLDHVDHVAGTVGVEHVAIGTDSAYVSRFAGDERRAIPSRGSTRERWEALWTPDAFGEEWRAERMALSLAWTNWPLFTVGLVQRGYTDGDIEKIVGGNVLRVARAALSDLD